MCGNEVGDINVVCSFGPKYSPRHLHKETFKHKRIAHKTTFTVCL